PYFFSWPGGIPPWPGGRFSPPPGNGWKGCGPPAPGGLKDGVPSDGGGGGPAGGGPGGGGPGGCPGGGPRLPGWCWSCAGAGGGRGGGPGACSGGAQEDGEFWPTLSYTPNPLEDPSPGGKGSPWFPAFAAVCWNCSTTLSGSCWTCPVFGCSKYLSRPGGTERIAENDAALPMPTTFSI